jgi:hypothetical protein
MQVYLDIHGVIADFIGGIEKRYNLDLSHHSTFDFDFDLLGMTSTDFWKGLTEDFWDNLELTPWAEELLEYLLPYDPILISTPSWNGAGGVQKWICNKLPGFIERGDYALMPNKWRMARPDRLLIDDKDKNCVDWIAHGGEALLFPRRWNASKHFTSVKTQTPKEKLDYVFTCLRGYLK